ncbi:hypothetical protein M3Y98_00801500 [Aphelenchoides besseyi]|nr:hypothetical protein M3Y98_00801500 [Aphelenchoides besseyi]KAI6212042.1 hypothetical protein M3Y96_00498300 [Aphelenchoides besseyi]
MSNNHRHSTNSNNSPKLDVPNDDDLYGVAELREALNGAKNGLNNLLVELDQLHEVLDGDSTIPALTNFRTDVAKMIARVAGLLRKLTRVAYDNDIRDIHAFVETRSSSRRSSLSSELDSEFRAKKIKVDSNQLVYQFSVYKLY